MGGVVLGCLVSLLVFLLVKRQKRIKRRGREREPIPFLSTGDGNRYDSLASQLSPPAEPHRTLSPQHSFGAPSLTSSITLPQEYSIEPYQPYSPPHLEPRRSATGSDFTAHPPRQSWNNDSPETHARTISGSVSVPEPPEPGSQVYVIHHDSGRAPVSVITARGTEVVELPPGYSPDFLHGSGGAGSSAQTGAPAPTHRRPRKAASGSR